MAVTNGLQTVTSGYKWVTTINNNHQEGLTCGSELVNTMEVRQGTI